MNQHPQRTPSAAGTPRLERLLDALRSRLSRHVWLHGAGTALGICAAWLVFAFFADRVLRVPQPVRIAHGLILLGLAGFFVWRGLVRPLTSLPSRSGLAILYERQHPEVQERFVSAVQFQERGAREDGSPELVQRVLTEADELAGGVEPDDVKGVFDGSEPRARFLLGSAAVLVVAGGAVFNPTEARIFLDRLVGGSTPWPQRTTLTVDVPMEGPGVQIARSPERIEVRVARGTDVPVLVRAAGEVPAEVRLHFEAGRDMVLNPSGGGAFRTLLRSCQENVSFVATGGDDLDGKPTVSIEVLRPPDVEGIAFEVRPPEYSELEPELVFQREVDVLAGSEVRVHVLPEPRDAEGTVRILPDERTVLLRPAPFPRRPEATDGPAPEEVLQGLAFDWQATASVGFRVELSDETELTNPEPGLFRIRVIEDRPPEVQILQPSRSEFEVVKGGAFALRVRAEDDFGLESLRWDMEAMGLTRETFQRDGSFPLTRVGDAEGPLRAAAGHVRLEVDDLGTEERPVSVDQRYEIEVIAEDNRRPAAGIGRSTKIRARVVTPEELLRRMQDRLAQTRLAAVRLSDLQREKKQRVRELIEASEGDGSSLRAESLALAGALGGQRRVAVDSRSLARELASITEDILYSRTDEKAGALLELYDAEQATLTDALFHPEPWLALAAAQDAQAAGTSGFAGNLVQLVNLALDISETHAPDAALALAEAEKSANAAEIRTALIQAEALQELSLQRMDDLLVRLAEWDNYQNILALTRDILNRQKALRERTQQFAQQK